MSIIGKWYKDFKEMEIGTIPKEWEVVRLGEVAEIHDSKRIPLSETERSKRKGSYPYCGANGIIDYIDDYIFEGEFVLLAEDGGDYKRFGNSAYIMKGKFWVNNHAHILKAIEDKVTNLFLYYFFNFSDLNFYIVGSTRKKLNQEQMKKILVFLPPLPEQKKIAEILSTVDQAIEKVDDSIAKTERLKNGLMQKLLTKGIGHKEFKDTEIGRIPKEWEVVRLGEVADLNRGRFAHRPRNDPKFYGGKIPFIQTGDINEANGIIKKYSQTLNEKGLKISKLFKKGTIVISIAGNIGDVGILDFDACFPDSIIGINPNDKKVDRLFLMFLLQEFKDKLNAIAPRSTQKNINLEILEPLKLPLPPLPEQQKIAEILSTVDKRLELLRAKKEKLERVKKGLMNDLLTGKRRIRIC